MKGFTFIELLIVVAIISLLMTLTVPLGVNFYRKQQLETATEGVMQTLRMASVRAKSQSDYNFGVYVGSGQTGEYFLFRGNDWVSHDEEEVFYISNSISFSGLSEVVFSKLEGLPSATGDVILTSGNDSETISVNELGRISYEFSFPEPPPANCWGTEGSCDSLCLYYSQGNFTDYYQDPDCSDGCPVVGNFYIDPAGPCSDDGTGSCYKVISSSTQSIVCEQGEPCEDSCTGVCTPCEEIPIGQCNQQAGCFAQPPRCIGTCNSCDTFSNEELCTEQQGCSWEETKWYWSLEETREGYDYTNCTWLTL